MSRSTDQEVRKSSLFLYIRQDDAAGDETEDHGMDATAADADEEEMLS